MQACVDHILKIKTNLYLLRMHIFKYIHVTSNDKDIKNKKFPKVGVRNKKAMNIIISYFLNNSNNN